MNDEALIIAPTYRMGQGLARKLGFLSPKEFDIATFDQSYKLHGQRPSVFVIYETDFARLPDEIASYLQPVIHYVHDRNNRLEPWSEKYERIFRASYFRRLWWALRGSL